MVSSDDGWAVGRVGTILHWDGTSWNTVTSPTTKSLTSVYMVNANNGWAVGDVGTIIHWDGTSWSEVTSPTSRNLFSIFMVNSDDGWIVGANGEIMRYIPPEWIPEFPTGIILPFLLILMSSVTLILRRRLRKRKNQIDAK